MVPSIVHRAFHRSDSGASKSAAVVKQMISGAGKNQNIQVNEQEVAKTTTTASVDMTATTTTSTKPTIQKKPKSAMTTVYIGPKQQRFKVNKKLLCASSSFFRERIEDPNQPRSVSLWLPGESPAMFAMFVEWLHDRYNFRTYLDGILEEAQTAGHQAAQETHWALIRLHLFASHLYILSLQDNAMDAIQDLYLRCDWDVTPGLITYLYTKCESIPAVRLRRWAVAMVAHSLARSPYYSSDPLHSPLSPVSIMSDDPESSDHARFRDLVGSLKEFGDDYNIHIQKLQVSGLDIRSKNPQMRIPANKLRNEERNNGFRECSFHSHRATVGEKRCPHERKRMLRAAANGETPKQSEDDASLAPRSSDHLSPTWKVSQERMSRPLFRVEEEEEDSNEPGLKHVRSISSTLR